MCHIASVTINRPIRPPSLPIPQSLRYVPRQGARMCCCVLQERMRVGACRLAYRFPAKGRQNAMPALYGYQVECLELAVRCRTHLTTLLGTPRMQRLDTSSSTRQVGPRNMSYVRTRRCGSANCHAVSAAGRSGRSMCKALATNLTIGRHLARLHRQAAWRSVTGLSRVVQAVRCFVGARFV